MRAKGKQLGRAIPKGEDNSRRSKIGQTEWHGNAENLSCMLYCPFTSSIYPQYFFVQCITLLLCQHLRVATHVSLPGVPATTHAC